MLPKLRIILAAVFATCAAVLALSAGVLGPRPGDDLVGVPEVSRTLMRQAIVAEPDPQFQLLAYSRRADELLRLRDLPVTPARAVVDYAERAQARAAETANAPAATSPAGSLTAAASEPAPTAEASTPTPISDPPAVPATDRAAGATPPTDAPPSVTVAMAPATNPRSETTAAIPVVQPAGPPPVVTAPPGVTARAPADSAAAPDAAPAETAAAPPPTSSDTRVAAVEPGGSATAEMYGPEKPKTGGKTHRRAKVVHPHLPKAKKKPQVAAATPHPAPTPSTGTPVNQPNNRNNGFGGWRYDSPAR
jgi:hypothetical protein